MKLFRKVLFWCHLVVGVVFGLVVLIMAATGVLLTYEKQIITWSDARTHDGGPPAAALRPLGTEKLLEGVMASEAGTPTSILWRTSKDAPVEVSFGRERKLFVNAYTGVVLGEGNTGVRAFFRTVTDLHRWLALAGENRSTGRALTGAANLGFLFLVLSGFYLWWPRNWTLKAVRNVIFFRRGLSPKARDFNWHHVVGFWSLIPLFLVVASGVVISYPWASNMVYRVVGEEPPARRGPGGGGQGAAVAERRGSGGGGQGMAIAERRGSGGSQGAAVAERRGPGGGGQGTAVAERRGPGGGGQGAAVAERRGPGGGGQGTAVAERRGPGGGGQGAAVAERRGPGRARMGSEPDSTRLDLTGLDARLVQASRRVADWRTISVQIPAPGDSTFTFSIDAGTGGQPQKRAQLTLDRATGAEVRWEPFAAGTPGRRLRSILRFAHTGEVLGIAGQTLAGIVSLGTTILVWTGLALSWRRLRSWRRRKHVPGKSSPVQAA